MMYLHVNSLNSLFFTFIEYEQLEYSQHREIIFNWRYEKRLNHVCVAKWDFCENQGTAIIESEIADLS